MSCGRPLMRTVLLIGLAGFAAGDPAFADGKGSKGAKGNGAKDEVSKPVAAKPASSKPADGTPSANKPTANNPVAGVRPRADSTGAARPAGKPASPAQSKPAGTPIDGGRGGKVERPVRSAESTPPPSNPRGRGDPTRKSPPATTFPTPRDADHAPTGQDARTTREPGSREPSSHETVPRPSLRERLRDSTHDRETARERAPRLETRRHDAAELPAPERTLETDDRRTDWPSNQTVARRPRLESKLETLPRAVHQITPPSQRSGTTTPTNVNIDIDIDVDVARARHRHDGIDVGFYFGDPRNRHPCYTDPYGLQYGYVFCGSSLWWYSWRLGYAPCFNPYRYYWAPSCDWLPSYYPSYATVYVVRDDVILPPADDPLASSSPPPAAGSAVDGDVALAEGWTHFAASRYPEALDTFRQAVLAKPDDPFAKVALAQACFAIGNYPDAAFLIRRAAALLPDWPVLGDDPRSHYGDPANHFEQMVALRAFLERVPGEPAATLVLAQQSYFTGDLAVARDAFARLALLDPGDSVPQLFALRLRPLAAPGATGIR
ncbi:MAG: tetratricopeptide repeat protein [Planctomycetes bacterium]|nr:tetratricopeptide repeat protein [Planctomycetota bacterium]